LYKNWYATETLLHAQREKTTLVRREDLYTLKKENSCLGHWTNYRIRKRHNCNVQIFVSTYL